MKKFLLFLIVGFTFAQCSDDGKSSCSIPATVRDLTGLDGCRFVFELEDGTYLEAAGSDDKENPLYGFEFVDGKRVKISYEETGNMSICMVGPVVKITCIKEVSVSNPEED